MLSLFALSIINAGLFISRDRMILSLVEVVAVAVSAITGTLPTIEQISLILPNRFQKAFSLFFTA